MCGYCAEEHRAASVVITLFWRPYWKGQCKWSSALYRKWMGAVWKHCTLTSISPMLKPGKYSANLVLSQRNKSLLCGAISLIVFGLTCASCLFSALSSNCESPFPLYTYGALYLANYAPEFWHLGKSEIFEWCGIQSTNKLNINIFHCLHIQPFGNCWKD